MTSTFVATAGLDAAPLEDGSVLYNPKTGKFIMLNRSAAFLFNEMSTPRTDDELIHRLCAAFSDMATAAAQQEVSQALELLKDLDLVRQCDADEAPHAVAALNGAFSGPEDGKGKPKAFERPTAKVLDEDELLKIFQMTAAEISVASCWWGACTVGCP
jgi:PqqD family protein of HPr-rel-A system